MSDWGDPDLPPPYKERSVDGAAVALGIVASFFVVVGISILTVGVFWIGLGAGIAVVAGAIWLCTQPTAFRKGFGVGLLVGYALVLLLVGACFAIVAGSIH
jgi:hypothetical protein